MNSFCLHDDGTKTFSDSFRYSKSSQEIKAKMIFEIDLELLVPQNY